MKPLRWNAEKNDRLKTERGIGFENIVVAIEAGNTLDIIAHPNQVQYPNQRILIVNYNNYAYLVPFIEETEYFFLKTIIPSRKATRDFLNMRRN